MARTGIPTESGEVIDPQESDGAGDGSADGGFDPSDIVLGGGSRGGDSDGSSGGGGDTKTIIVRDPETGIRTGKEVPADLDPDSIRAGDRWDPDKGIIRGGATAPTGPSTDDPLGFFGRGRDTTAMPDPGKGSGQELPPGLKGSSDPRFREGLFRSPQRQEQFRAVLEQKLRQQLDDPSIELRAGEVPFSKFFGPGRRGAGGGSAGTVRNVEEGQAAGVGGLTVLQARQLEKQILEENPELTAADIGITLDRQEGVLTADLTEQGTRRRLEQARGQIEKELERRTGVDLDPGRDIEVDDDGAQISAQLSPAGLDRFVENITAQVSNIGNIRGGPLVRFQDTDPIELPAEIRGSAQQPLPKLDQELDQQYGVDLERGVDYTVDVDRTSGEPTAVTSFTGEGRIKIAGRERTGETFLDERIINPAIADFEKFTGLDVPFDSDVVQDVEEFLAKSAQVQREGKGVIPSPEQAIDRMTADIGGRERILTVGGPFGTLPKLAPVESFEGQQRAGFVERAFERLNPAEIALGAGKVVEGAGEFGFNTAVGSFADEAESVDAEIHIPELDTTFEEITTEARERQRAQKAAVAVGVGALATSSIKSFEEDPIRTLGSAKAEVGLAAAAEPISPVRVSTATLPLRSGRTTTLRAVKVGTPRILDDTIAPRGVTVAGTRGFKPTVGTPDVPLRQVEFAELPGVGVTTEPIGELETVGLQKGAFREGGELRARTEAVEDVMKIGEARVGTLELETTEDIVRQARDVSEEAAPAIAEAIEELDATIFGSAAVKAQFPEFRAPRDVDLVVENKAAAARRLDEALEGSGRSTRDVFDIKTFDEKARPGELLKFGRRAQKPLKTVEGVSVAPLSEELIKKTGASGFFRGAGAPGGRFIGESFDIDIGPEPVAPGKTPRFKDVADASALARAAIREKLGPFTRFRPLKRRRLAVEMAAVERFDELFEAEFSGQGAIRTNVALNLDEELSALTDLSVPRAGAADRAQLDLASLLPEEAAPGRARGAVESLEDIGLGDELDLEFGSPSSAGRTATDPFGSPVPSPGAAPRSPAGAGSPGAVGGAGGVSPGVVAAPTVDPSPFVDPIEVIESPAPLSTQFDVGLGDFETFDIGFPGISIDSPGGPGGTPSGGFGAPPRNQPDEPGFPPKDRPLRHRGGEPERKDDFDRFLVEEEFFTREEEFFVTETPDLDIERTFEGISEDTDARFADL